MKIAVCTSFEPFDHREHDIAAKRLARLLESGGHHVEHVRLPIVGDSGSLLSQFAAYRWVDLSAADCIVCFAPAAHLIPHPAKIVYFAGFLADAVPTAAMAAVKEGTRRTGLVRAVDAADRAALREARRVWVASPSASEQLSQRFGITAGVMNPVFQDALQLADLLS